MNRPIDAVLAIAFGGPTRPDEIRPFLEHVLRGRPVPPGRIEAVAHHYEVIGGSSPINAWTERQARALQARLAERGTCVPVRMGMRHAAPFLVDALRALSQAGARRVAGVVMAAFYDSSTLQRYGAAVEQALVELAAADLTVEYVAGPDAHPGFVDANAAHIRDAIERLTPEQRARMRLMFTAHSIPQAIGERSGYVTRFEAAAERIAAALGVTEYACVYQSRSGAPSERWLEPDVCEALRQHAAQGVSAVVLAPIGFVCDHVEVLYDLDVEAAAVARSLGLPIARAQTAGDHPGYIEALADAVLALG